MEKYIYRAKLDRVVDGDTVDAMIDLGFNTWVKRRIRFHGVDTWECRTRNLEEKKKGLAAKARTKELLTHVTNKPGYFRVKSHGVGKYGRVFTPIGAGITAAGLGIDAYKYIKKRYCAIKRRSTVCDLSSIKNR